MMTTDTVSKQSTRSIRVGDQTITISAAAKGAAMIAPNMATMLSVVLTDADLSADQAGAWLRSAVDQSFNCISIDGHMSTSDTVLLLANGASGVRPQGVNEGPFREGLNEVCLELAQSIIRDAEGAGHFVTIKVSGLATDQDAVRIARQVADSALVKTAIAGNDPNWGRIVSAAGYAGVAFQENEVSLWLNGLLLYERGLPTRFDAAAVSRSLQSGQVEIDLRFASGNGSARFWTSDLTQEYVRLNSEYTT
jgi:glutamate N-acetyltransferase/amino-acid N-acetyltransferase